MPPKSQNAGVVGDQPNSASFSTNDIPDAGILDVNTKTQPNSPSAAQQIAQDAHENTGGPETATKSTTAGSDPSAKDAMSGPSPYGTRSRNRGQPRPNYAEDKDMDTEMFDAYPEKKEQEAKKTARQAVNGAADAPRVGGSSARKVAPADESKSVNSQPAVKDQQSAPATAVTNATVPITTTSTKKRKAAAQPAISVAQPQTSTAIALGTAATTSRRNTTNAPTTVSPGFGYRESNMLSFDRYSAKPKDGKLVADDGTIIGKNDHVYLVCEPPGEPYYLGRIMEFLHMQNDVSKPVDALRINWYYRPKDIGKKVNDTRTVFATMHSDISPLTALRGKCDIRHKAEISNIDEYRKTPDSFWFEKLYDRYIQKHYEVIPCSQIVNVPEKVKKVLDERWKYILVEQGRSKEFTSAVKLCKRCSGYCANNDSVDCAVCKQTYHMNCVRPPLLKKPSRGFAWACAACSRAQERKLEARHTPSLVDPHPENEEEEIWDEEEEDHGAGTNRTTPADGIDDTHQPATAEQIYQASLWPWRYLGQHCKPEDALDYDDRIYPRAGSRLGPKHQAIVLPWPGQPVELVKPLEIKRGRKEKPTKEQLAALEAEKLARETRPKWVQDEPPGYVARGEDYDNADPRNTAQLLWKPVATVNAKITETEVDAYMEKAMRLAPSLGLPELSTNLMDIARDVLFRNHFDTVKALKVIPTVDRAEFKEPELSMAEQKKFEEAVTKFGSELHHVRKHVKTLDYRTVVRYYYTWKKTPRGVQVWGSFSGRKGKKEAKKAAATANKLQDDVADDYDDSAFDTEKAMDRKRNFMCKFCNTKNSRQWRRAPNVSTALVTEGSGKNKDKGAQYIVALCRRCAELWRRYAIQWEDMDALAKQLATGGRTWKRKIDEELLKELNAANEMMSATVYNTPSPAAAQPTPVAVETAAPEHPRKRLKASTDKETEPNASDTSSVSGVMPPKKKEKVAEKPAPPPVPEIPKPRTLPCAICDQLEPAGEQHLLSCKECRLSVHRKCYGVVDNRHPGKWTCDMCLNDKNPQLSLEYKCVLCPVEFTEHDFVEPPKNTAHKKKDKEREKQEREAAQKAADYYRKKQEEMNRPLNPREPLKRTADNNWVHVTCAIWTPEVKFGSAKALSPSEGIPSIPRVRYDEVCKACKKTGGACVACHQCKAPVHVECARQSGMLLGFEITPIKGSRRDQFNIVTMNGETGTMSAAVWCQDHNPTKTVVHLMHHPVEQPEGEAKEPTAPNALQFYVQNFKQADLTLTGTVRKANLIAMATKTPVPTTLAGSNRRASTTVTPINGTGGQRASSTDNPVEPSHTTKNGDKVCITCGIDISPKWWPIEKDQEKALINGHLGNLGSEAQKFVEQRTFQCHKCKKAGKVPMAHVAPPPADETPRLEPIPAPPAIAPPRSPPAVLSEPRAAAQPYSWGPPGQASVPPSAPPPVAAPPIQAPVQGPPPPLPLNAPHARPSPIAAPPHVYSHGGPSYSDWHRNATQRSPPLHQLNGGTPAPNAVHLNHLRDLRPPPITSVTHHPAPPLRHGSIGPPLVNGLPPSPRRDPPMQNGAGYPPAYHHQTHHSLHNLTNGGPPPRPTEHTFSQALLGQRSPFQNPHGSPPISREGLPMNLEANMSNNPPPRASDARPASGASASPSLRNLLS